MKKQACVVGIIVILTVVTVIVFAPNLDLTGVEPPFDNEGRYDATVLNNMDVIYLDRADILSWTEGYSESTSCPWGFEHNGLDFFFINESTVIAVAPGIVEEISWTDTGPADNIYMIHVSIRFNATIQIGYVFEPWTTNSSDVDRQIAMLEINEGDWIAKGDTLGEFLQVGGGAHIHFSVYDGEATCPRPFFSDDAYTEMMELVHTYQPSWELCYP